MRRGPSTLSYAVRTVAFVVIGVWLLSAGIVSLVGGDSHGVTAIVFGVLFLGLGGLTAWVASIRRRLPVPPPIDPASLSPRARGFFIVAEILRTIGALVLATVGIALILNGLSRDFSALEILIGAFALVGAAIYVELVVRYWPLAFRRRAVDGPPI